MPVPGENKGLATRTLLTYKAAIQSPSYDHLPRHALKTLSPGRIARGGHRAPGPRQQPLSPRVAHVIETGPCSPPRPLLPQKPQRPFLPVPAGPSAPSSTPASPRGAPTTWRGPHLWASNRLPNGGCLQACWPCHASTNKNLHGDSHSLPTRPPSVLGAAISPLGVWFAFSCFLWCRLMSISCECHAVKFMNCPKGRHWNGKSRKIR